MTFLHRLWSTLLMVYASQACMLAVWRVQLALLAAGLRMIWKKPVWRKPT